MSVEQSQTTTPAAPDYDDIVAVVQTYVDGFNDADAGKFREAFHEDARITFTTADGELGSFLISDCFDEWASENPPGQNVRGRVIAVTQAGDVAVVVLGYDYLPDLSDSWLDVHSLLRLDGTWKIMNKTATHSSRAAWAAPPDA